MTGRNPQPCILNPQPSTLNPQASSLKPQASSLWQDADDDLYGGFENTALKQQAQYNNFENASSAPMKVPNPTP